MPPVEDGGHDLGRGDEAVAREKVGERLGRESVGTGELLSSSPGGELGVSSRMSPSEG
jgi:hypothetical protein